MTAVYKLHMCVVSIKYSTQGLSTVQLFINFRLQNNKTASWKNILYCVDPHPEN